MVLSICGWNSVKADSPLTSTTFYTAYLEYDVVANAAQTMQMDNKTLLFLIDSDERLDVKVAVINALGWAKAEPLAPVLLQSLSDKYKHNDLSRYAADDITCYAYMLAMDDYFNVADAAALIESARNMQQGSATISMIWAIIQGQLAMDYSWCDVWLKTSEALRSSSEPRDMKTAAIQNIVDYTILYKEYCY